MIYVIIGITLIGLGVCLGIYTIIDYRKYKEEQNDQWDY